MLAGSASAQVGRIVGEVVSRESLQGVGGASVRVREMGRAVLADSMGRFVVGDLAPGNYSLEVSRLGFRPVVLPDVIVRPVRATSVRAELDPSAVVLEGISVLPSYFQAPQQSPASEIRFTAEEIRRAPGSAGDVSRIVLGLPSVAKVNDQYNGLAVRGGSATENLFLVDGIPIPNINHFPSQGTSGGAIGLLNVDLIRDVRFQAGGFGPQFGGRLSSVLEIDLREGNREEFDGQLDLNFAGFGGVAEGPLPGPGSWVVSWRRSYLDLLVDAIDVGTSLAPRFGDGQAKVSYAAGTRHRLSGLAVWADDRIHSDLDVAIENDMLAFGRQDLGQATVGGSWRALWSGSTYSTTAASVSWGRFDEAFTETATGLPLLANNARERALRLRSVTRTSLGEAGEIRFGADVERLFSGYRMEYGAHLDPLGAEVAALTVDGDLEATGGGVFAGVRLAPLPRIGVDLGIRADRFAAVEGSHLSPRAGLRYHLSASTTVGLSGGLFLQPLPDVLLAQNDAHRTLPPMRATHAVVSLEQLLTPSTRLSVEAYDKRYRDLPIDPLQPELLVIDEPVGVTPFFSAHERLEPTGEATSRGLEAVLQQRLAERVHGLVSAAYARSRYRGADGAWRSRAYDNRYLFSAEGGYRVPRGWEVSGRWIFAGGPPYTPIDVQRSAALGQTILEEGAIHGERYPDYHSLNLRVDRRFNFRRSNLTAYISVWNAYGRRNIANYFWNPRTEAVEAITQWGTLPIFGLEYEF